MVIGERSKSRKRQVEYYTIHVEEIKPWPPSQSLRTLRSVVIQWEHGDKSNCGFTNQVVPSIADARIDFNDSFRLSIKGDAKKCIIDFNLYEPRRDKLLKGQLLGSAVVDLAAYGVIKETLSVTTPINCIRTYRNTVQPLLFLRIQPNRRNHVESLMNQEYAQEAEVDDDDDDGDDDVSLNKKNEEEQTAESSSMDLSSDIAWISKRISSQNLHSSAIKETDGIQENGERGSKDSIIHQTDEHLASAKTNGFTDNETSEKHVEKSRIIKEEEQKIENELTDLLSSTKETVAVPRNGKSVRSSVESSKSNGSTNKDAKTYRKVLSDNRIQHLEERIKILEGELREAAAIELSLYSVVAEHGSSMKKVHAPARRLSRLYFHANKHSPKSGRASAAKSIVSGLVLVAKACGNDVPRLTFWLSNTIVLRVIISKSFENNQPPVSIGRANGKISDKIRKKRASPLMWDSFPSQITRHSLEDSVGDWENPLMFVDVLEKIDAWIFSRIIESLWWQTFIPHMQSGAAKDIHTSMDSDCSKLYRRTSSSIDHQQGNFSLELWEKAFKDACERICPVRAGGHECGCLPVLSKLIMEQLIARLDVAMFNAILRESSDEIPTDPIADPISDAKVLPIPSGKASFGAGAQLKSAIGNWSRWLTDLFGMDDDEDNVVENENSSDDDKQRPPDASSKSFHLLNALSDLMMLPKDLLLSPTIRKEVCPAFGAPLIRRILNSFIPDEFCPDPIPGVVLEALNSEDPLDLEDNSIIILPCEAAPITYKTPSVASVASVLGEFDGSKQQQQLTRSGSSILSKLQTSDDELDELESPLILDSLQTSPSSVNTTWISPNTVRYQLLRQVWLDAM